MRPQYRPASLATLSACVLIFFLPGVELRPSRAQEAQRPVSPTPGGPTTQRDAARTPATSREQRQRAYAKLLEGQRYLGGARTGGLTIESLRLAQKAFQDAAELDPALAEARTALAEIAFYFLNDLQKAEAEALAAARIDRDNLGAHRILARVHTLKSGLFGETLDRASAERAVTELREVVRLNAVDSEAWALLGEFYQATGREDESIKAFTRWASLPPATEDRFYQIITKGRQLAPDTASARLGEVLLRAGRTKEAITSILNAIAVEPENKSHLELLGRALEAEEGGGSQAALTELKRLVAVSPNNATAISILAAAHARAGRIDEAVATIREALPRFSEGTQDKLTLQADLAQIYAEAFRFSEAVEAYEAILKSRGIGSEPVASERERSLASLGLGRIVTLQRQARQTSEALATIERMRRLLGRDDASADQQYVTLLRDQGKRREALEVLRAARARFPEEASFARLEALTLAELGQTEAAAAMLRARLKGKAEEDFNEYLVISSIYLEAGRGREAVEAAQKALDLAPSSDQRRATEALLMLSSAQERAGDPRGSEQSLRRILAKEPNNATALNNLGYFLVERNERLPEALEMIQRAVRAEPTNPSFLDSLGWAYFKLGQLEQAERYLSDAARRNPSSATIQEHLGDIFHRLGKMNQARAAWQKALSLSFEDAETARIKAKLSGEMNK